MMDLQTGLLGALHVLVLDEKGSKFFKRQCRAELLQNAPTASFLPSVVEKALLHIDLDVLLLTMTWIPTPSQGSKANL